eukprot:COSAG05_NODE_1158_length_5680_cov_39.705787_2_plen_106_part_00
MQDVIDEYQGADTAEAERKDSHAAERLLEEGLLNSLLLQSLCEVVQNEANGVLTNEAVEQLLDTTMALATIERWVRLSVDPTLPPCLLANLVIAGYHTVALRSSD